jgi:hypothetical protein
MPSVLAPGTGIDARRRKPNSVGRTDIALDASSAGAVPLIGPGAQATLGLEPNSDD